jgi:aquaporin Z
VRQAPLAEPATTRLHWPEYLMEGVELGIFMLAACTFAVLLGHPSSPVLSALPGELGRRSIMGVAMALTAVALIYSPWGQQSGAHFNPCVTLTYLRLGKIDRTDAIAYVAAQFVGGVIGVELAGLALGALVAHPAVDFATTVPGAGGIAIAFVAELTISFVLMSVVLWASNHRRLNRFTGLFVGLLVAAYITLEAPLSGMSMNPARTFGSAYVAYHWTAVWLYFTAPPLGMLAAAELYLWRRGESQVFCAKLNHRGGRRCIFRCRFGQLGEK